MLSANLSVYNESLLTMESSEIQTCTCRPVDRALCMIVLLGCCSLVSKELMQGATALSMKADMPSGPLSC